MAMCLYSQNLFSQTGIIYSDVEKYFISNFSLLVVGSNFPFYISLTLEKFYNGIQIMFEVFI